MDYYSGTIKNIFDSSWNWNVSVRHTGEINNYMSSTGGRVRRRRLLEPPERLRHVTERRGLEKTNGDFV